GTQSKPLTYFAIQNCTFNGALTVAVETSNTARFLNTTFNGPVSLSGPGNTELYAITANANLTILSGVVSMGTSSMFASGTVVNVYSRFIANNYTHTFRNNFTLQNNSQFLIGFAQTYQGSISMGSGVTASFSGGAQTFTQPVSVGSGSTVTFTNTAATTLDDVTLAAGSTWRFSASSTSTVNGDFLTNGSCSAPVSVNSNTGSSQASVKFTSFSNPQYVNISNINNTGSALNMLYGIGTNNTNISIASARTLYWVGNSGSW
ncbi:hypothetical protein, partial [Xanthocytophaga agilis]